MFTYSAICGPMLPGVTQSPVQHPACLQRYGWTKGREYLRLEGGTAAKTRQKEIQLFQDPASAAQVPKTFCNCALSFATLLPVPSDVI